MSADEARKNAVQFLKDQAAIMRKYGDTPKMRGDDYKAALNETAKKFESLSAARKKTA